MIKTGIGQDSHRFEKESSGKKLFLGGVIGVTDAAETWQALEAEVFQISELIVQSVLKEDVSEEEIQPLRDEISQLETQFSSSAQQCPSTEACASLQYIISTAQEMANFVPGTEFSVEEMGKIAFLRQAMHNYRTGTRSQETTSPDPQLQFQIGYAYLPAGTKQFQDLKN